MKLTTNHEPIVIKKRLFLVGKAAPGSLAWMVREL